ncbi:MAG TPA: AAA family ATPase [Candidatus Acidoferrum sp.]|nr:AAA family ATPase [Candidatus Acidoferrum sp.]
MAKKAPSVLKAPFLKRLTLLPERMQADDYPFNLPILEGGRLALDFDRPITFFVGDNGTGKSTLLEAIARQCGFSVLGGGRNQASRDRTDGPDLASALRLSWLPKVTKGFFLRAESFFDFASYIDEMGPEGQEPYGGKPLHAQSHGQSFFALFENRLRGARQAIYLLDEPEAALSPQRQIEFLGLLRAWEEPGNVQMIIATHSPIIMSYPGATLLSFDGGQIRPARYTETDHYRVTRRFLMDHESVLRQLFSAADTDESDA